MKYLSVICLLFLAIAFAEEECKDEEYCSGYLDIHCKESHIQVECCQKCQALAAKNPENCKYGEEDWCGEYKDSCNEEEMKTRCCLTCAGGSTEGGSDEGDDEVEK